MPPPPPSSPSDPDSPRRPAHQAWSQIRLPNDQQLRRRLQQRHWLRLHVALVIGLTLAVMLGMSAWLLHAGVHSMALRYGVALLLGYAVYLVLLRLWAGCMLRRDWDGPDPSGAELPGGRGGAAEPAPDMFRSAEGGEFAGGGASGHWGAEAASQVAEGASGVDLPVEAAESGTQLGLGSLDGLDLEGVVILPVLLLFAGLLLVFTGAGALLWAALGTELLLAVAVEVAFALLMARSLYVMEREGWLLVALRLSWKPMLAAVVLAVLLGAACDWLLPGADSLGQVLRSWRQGA
ncbi:MAG: hypothetical protein RR855_07690 [Comamonas sp.]